MLITSKTIIWPVDTSELLFDQATGHRDIPNLTHKINHHRNYSNTVQKCASNLYCKVLGMNAHRLFADFYPSFPD